MAKKTKLTLLGRSETKVPAAPAAKTLETFENPAKRPYWIRFHAADFTSLCPITGQADFAAITIDYQPAARCLETKSLKFYLASYRNERAFNENVTNHILDDLVRACEPREMTIKAEFAARGGIALTVTATFPRGRMKRAVVLLSGGLDSATVLAICRTENFEAHAISFRYGQRHAQELAAAENVARSLGATEHRIAEIDLRIFGGSALTDNIEVPKGRSAAEITRDIPVTYVPARNTIFLAYALAFAETIRASDIFLGVNALDYSGYPDCRPEFIRAFEQLANLATRAGVEGARFQLHAPLIEMTKAEIIRRGLSLGVDYSLTHSCYDPTAEGIACGGCDSCQLRLKGFREAGVEDPVAYTHEVA